MKNLVTMMLMLLMAIGAAAQTGKEKKEPELQVFGEVADFLTQNGVDTMQVVLLNATDSTVVDTAKISKWSYDGRVEISYVAKVTKPGDYLVRIASEGYKTKYVALSLPKLRRNERYRYLPTAYLQKERKKWDVELGEVVVKASQVKFFMDGDTLVYNADAFDMAEGSMLGELIRKLPGAELRAGGEIYVNGKKVSELQLNGSELMGSDNALMMENLPAFMVKNVKVYERAPREVKGTRKEKVVQKETVMNVRLKREYQKGWIANAEAGGGPQFSGKDWRWMGRLFASHFTNKSRLSVYASANNVNDNHTPGEGGEWNPLEQTSGQQTTYTAGVIGSTKTDEDVLSYNGNASLGYTETENENHSVSESFYKDGNTFGRSYSKSNSDNLNFSTNHILRYYQTVKPTLGIFKTMFGFLGVDGSHWRTNSRSKGGSATLDADVSEHWGKEWIDSLMADQMGDVLQKHVITRNINRSRSEGTTTNASAHGFAYATPLYNDKISLQANVRYSYYDYSSPGFSQFNIEGNTQDSQNRYTANDRRSNSFDGSFTAEFGLGAEGNHNISVAYNYNYADVESNAPIYLLHKLEGWKAGEHALGNLPSMDQLLGVMDGHNSERSQTTNNLHTPTIGYSYQHYNDSTSNSVNATAGLELPVRKERIDYHKGGKDLLLNRTTVFLTPTVTLWMDNYKKGFQFNASYSMSTEAPSQVQMVDIVDTSSPLATIYGNPNLRNTRTHNFNVSYRDRWKETIQFYANANYSLQQNAVAMGSVFDKATGKSVMKPENVNGNWNASARVGVTMPFDKEQKFVLTDDVNYSFVNSVDLTGTQVGMAPQRSVVGTHQIEEKLRFDWKPSSKVQFGAKGELNFRNSFSARTDFQTLNVYDFNYALTSQVELPWDLQFSTDITMYSRRGYSGKEMNTNELVWNARLSKRIKNWSIMVDALDILQNLTNVRYTVNAQGRTESYTNIIPSYALLHVKWNLNKKPKNKGAE